MGTQKVEKPEPEYVGILEGPSHEKVIQSIGIEPPFRIPALFKLNIFGNDLKEFEKRYNVSSPDTFNAEPIVLVHINGLDWEDGSGQSFNLRGRVISIKWNPGAREQAVNLAFSAYYHTNKRTGKFLFIKE